MIQKKSLFVIIKVCDIAKGVLKMGSPSYCYKEFMKEYVRINVCLTKYEKVYTNDYLKTLSESELEDLVKCFNKSHKAYAAFVAGVTVAHCSEKWNSCTDLLNASAGAISMFYDLLGIYDPDYIDFEEP